MKDRQTDRDRQIDRLKDRQTDRQIDRQTDREIDRKIDRYTDRQTNLTIMTENLDFDEFGEDFRVSDRKALDDFLIFGVENTHVGPALGTRVISGGEIERQTD